MGFVIQQEWVFTEKMELFELLTVPRILFQFHHFIWITLESAAFANILQNRLLKINPWKWL